jgi:hypothetical protein
VFVIGVGVAREAGIWWIALEMVVVATALQLGYLGAAPLLPREPPIAGRSCKLQQRSQASTRNRCLNARPRSSNNHRQRVAPIFAGWSGSLR